MDGVNKYCINTKHRLPFIGFPLPSTVWMKEGRNGRRIYIQDNEKYDITSQQHNDEIWYTLVIKNIRARDYTKYFCVGTNILGSRETSIVLFGM
jgi:hypothetical protein